MTMSTDIYFKSTKTTKGRNIGDNLNRTQKVKEEMQIIKHPKMKNPYKNYIATESERAIYERYLLELKGSR